MSHIAFVRKLPGVRIAEVVSFWVIITLAAGVKVNFQPSPPITILQKATFRCTLETNPGDTVEVEWRVNDTISSSSLWQNLNISVSGNSTDSHLHIPGDARLNGTEVKYKAVIFNGVIFDSEISNSVLIVQDRPAIVDLYCSSTVCTIMCYWSRPYTVDDFIITGYNISISSTNNSIVMTVMETEFNQNISEPGVHNISVVAVIGEPLLEGYRTTEIITLPDQCDSTMRDTITSDPATMTTPTLDPDPDPDLEVDLDLEADTADPEADTVLTKELIASVVASGIGCIALVVIIVILITLIVRKAGYKPKNVVTAC